MPSSWEHNELLKGQTSNWEDWEAVLCVRCGSKGVPDAGLASVRSELEPNVGIGGCASRT